MSGLDPKVIEKAAQAVADALADDDTHITPGVDPETIAARAVVNAVADDLRAEAALSRVLDDVEALATRWRGYGETAPTELDRNRWWSCEASLRALVARHTRGQA